MVAEAGIRLLHAMVVAPIVEDDAIIGVISSRSPGATQCGRVVIDATGDADIAHRVGTTRKTPLEEMQAVGDVP